MLQNDPLRLPPFHFDPDPDPAFQFGADPDPTFRSDADPDPTFRSDADPDSKMMRIHADPDPLHCPPLHPTHTHRLSDCPIFENTGHHGQTKSRHCII
jgi:hypothetical protein